jgi:hypothetical protein
MKALLAFITSCALAGGFLVGYLEYREEKDRAVTPAPRATVVPSPAGAKAPEKQEKQAPPESETKEAAPKAVSVSSAEMDAAIRDIEKLIVKGDFAGARSAVAAARQKYPRTAATARLLESILREERKIEAFEAVIGSLEQRELPDVLFVVDLENGGQITAKSRKESADRIDFEIVQGGVASWRKEQIRSTKPIPRKEYLDRRWSEIQASLKDEKNAFNLFFFGVKKAFRDGLKKEGLGLLEKLLVLPDSDQVISVSVKVDAAQLWAQAAGRKAFGPGAGGATVEVAMTDPENGKEPPAGSGESLAANGGGETPPEETKGAPAVGNIEPGEEEPSEEDGQAIAATRIRDMLEEAEKLHASKGDAIRIRMLLQSAAKLLYPLPKSKPEIGDLNRRVGTLLEKVMTE